MIGFISTPVTMSVLIKMKTALSLIYTLSSSPLHTHKDSQSSASRLLVTDLHTETVTSNYYKVFLLFRLQSLWNLGTKNSSGLIPPAYD
jgi:hypothetical protein